MLLLLDIGNTALTVCLSHEYRVLETGRVLLRDIRGDSACVSRKVEELVSRHGVPEDSVLCSVVPDAVPAVSRAVEAVTGKPPVLLTREFSCGVTICLRNSHTMGLDRYVAVCGGAGLCPGRDLIVIDYGTATTYDLVLGDGRFIAGLICAGMETRTWALNQRAAQLPLVPPERCHSILADHTEASLRAGNYYAGLGESRYIIEELKRQGNAPRARVIATGGYGRLMADALEEIDEYRPHLLFEGMERLYRAHREGEERAE